MKGVLIVTTFLLAFSNFCSAVTIIDSSLATACLKYNSKFNWDCSKSGHMNGYACLCGNINWLQSVTFCIQNNSHSKQPIEHAMKHVLLRCKSNKNIGLTFDKLSSIYNNGTSYIRNPTAIDLKTPVVGTLIPNVTEFNYYLTKFKQTTLFVERSQWFGWGMIFYWVTIVLICTLLNINKRWFGYRNIMNTNLIKKYIIFPSVYKYYRERTFLFCKFIPINFPTRIDGLIVSSFVILTIICVGMAYDIHLPHPSFHDQWDLNASLLSYRVDIMCISLFPLIYIFGIRNNPFIMLTGISLTSFNFYHKWCAYVCAALALIHSVIWTEWAQRYSTYKNLAERTYWKWGIGGTTLLFLLCFHSEKIFRDRFYETFLLIHKAMNIAFIVAMYYHISGFGWLGWIYAMIGIWSYDRVLRTTWIIINGGFKTAKLTDCHNNVIKLSIPKPKFFKYQPGMFVYIYFLSVDDAWFYSLQSHPFTILNEPQEDSQNTSNLVIYFKVNKGITKRMLKRLERSGKNEVSCKILLEGPYGAQLPHLAPVSRNYVGICAGLGITAIYPELNEMIQKTVSDDYTHKLYWVINNIEHLEWFDKQLNDLKTLGCQVTILCMETRVTDSPLKIDMEATTKIVSSSSSMSVVNSSDQEKGSIKIENLDSRPDLETIINQDIQRSQHVSKDITFLTCGPTNFNDFARYTMANSIRKQLTIDVDFEEKSFTW